MLFSLLERGDTMLSNSRGFTFIEILIAANLIFMVVTTIVPIASLLEKERTILNNRRVFIMRLHDELQPYLWENASLPATYQRLINQTNVTFNFIHEEKLMKGCATWENARETTETICLHGHP